MHGSIFKPLPYPCEFAKCVGGGAVGDLKSTDFNI